MPFFSNDQVLRMQGTTVRCSIMAEFEFKTETIRVWNGEHNLVSGGRSWVPMHGIGIIEGLQQKSDISSNQITITLTGFENENYDLISILLAETDEVVQRLCKIYLQFFDDEWQPIGDPVLIWFGFLQPPEVTTTPKQEFQGSQQTIKIMAENAYYNRAKPPIGKYTDRDQQRKFPGDSFFSFVPELVSKTFVYPDY